MKRKNGRTAQNRLFSAAPSRTSECVPPTSNPASLYPSCRPLGRPAFTAARTIHASPSPRDPQANPPSSRQAATPCLRGPNHLALRREIRPEKGWAKKKKRQNEAKSQLWDKSAQSGQIGENRGGKSGSRQSGVKARIHRPSPRLSRFAAAGNTFGSWRPSCLAAICGAENARPSGSNTSQGKVEAVVKSLREFPPPNAELARLLNNKGVF